MRRTFGALALPFALLLASCAPPAPVTETAWYLGTSCSVTLYGRNPQAVERVFTVLEDIDTRMGVDKRGSEIDRINEAAGREAVSVSASTFAVIESALHYAGLTGGAFDPTVGGLVRLWDIRTDRQAVPADETIQELLPAVGYGGISLDNERETVALLDGTTALDLGAIAKGYAADIAADTLRESGVRTAIIDFGGNILALGTKPDGSPWRVGVQDPLERRGSFLGIIETTASAIVTSGTYERFFEVDGVRYHHILDPSTGRPARTGLLSATIVADRAIDADALSTGLFVMGETAGLALAESLPGVEALFVTQDRRIALTGGLRNRFRLTSGNYTLSASE
jgi:thiamine biosynthesis lipoprotein